MDQSATPEQTVRLLLEIDRMPDGRLKGRASVAGTDTWEPFCGVLELLECSRTSHRLLTQNAVSKQAPAHPRRARNTYAERELS